MQLDEEEFELTRFTILYTTQEPPADDEPASSPAPPQVAEHDSTPDARSMPAQARSASTISANEFPLPPNGKRVGREFDAPVVMIDSDLSAAEITAFYDEALAKLGWKRNETGAPESNGGTALLQYGNADRSIQVVIHLEGNPFASIFAQGDGIDFETRDAADVAAAAMQIAQSVAEADVGSNDPFGIATSGDAAVQDLQDQIAKQLSDELGSTAGSDDVAAMAQELMKALQSDGGEDPFGVDTPASPAAAADLAKVMEQAFSEEALVDPFGVASPSPGGGEDLERMLEAETGLEPSGDDAASSIQLDNSMASRAKNTSTCRLSLGDERVELKHALAYQYVDPDGFDGPELVTGLLFTEKPLPNAKVRKQLARGDRISMIDLMEFDFFDYMQVEISDGNASCNCYVQGTSMSFGGSDEMTAQLTIDRGWIHGTVAPTEPHDFFDKKFNFEATVDLAALHPSAEDLAMADELQLEERRGLPLPAETTGIMMSGSIYSTTAECTTEGTTETLAALYRAELPKMGWTETSYQWSGEERHLTFDGSKGQLNVKLSPDPEGSKVEVALRDEAAAKQDGMLPVAGKGKLILGNASDHDVVITIGKTDYPVKAGVGAEDPTKAIKYDVPPGKYSITIKVPGESPQQESLQIETGTTWGVIVTPSGMAFTDQVY